jgi:hypothetical protein
MIISTEPEIDWEGHTLAIDPQEGAGRFPFQKHSAAKEPLSGSVMLDAACNGVIR